MALAEEETVTVPTLTELRAAVGHDTGPEPDLRAVVERLVANLNAPWRAAVKAISDPCIIIDRITWRP
jgi:hypothetical protein